MKILSMIGTKIIFPSLLCSFAEKNNQEIGSDQSICSPLLPNLNYRELRLFFTLYSHLQFSSDTSCKPAIFIAKSLHPSKYWCSLRVSKLGSMTPDQFLFCQLPVPNRDGLKENSNSSLSFTRTKRLGLFKQGF